MEEVWGVDARKVNNVRRPLKKRMFRFVQNVDSATQGNAVSQCSHDMNTACHSDVKGMKTATQSNNDVANARKKTTGDVLGEHSLHFNVNSGSQCSHDTDTACHNDVKGMKTATQLNTAVAKARKNRTGDALGKDSLDFHGKKSVSESDVDNSKQMLNSFQEATRNNLLLRASNHFLSGSNQNGLSCNPNNSDRFGSLSIPRKVCKPSKLSLLGFHLKQSSSDCSEATGEKTCVLWLPLDFSLEFYTTHVHRQYLDGLGKTLNCRCGVPITRRKHCRGKKKERCCIELTGSHIPGIRCAFFQIEDRLFKVAGEDGVLMLTQLAFANRNSYERFGIRFRECHQTMVKTRNPFAAANVSLESCTHFVAQITFDINFEDVAMLIASEHDTCKARVVKKNRKIILCIVSKNGESLRQCMHSIHQGLANMRN